MQRALSLIFGLPTRHTTIPTRYVFDLHNALVHPLWMVEWGSGGRRLHGSSERLDERNVSHNAELGLG